jgi:phage terminase large subunit GpA-like protein
VLAFDEVDGYPGSLQGEGDPVSLGETRTETFTFNKKIFLCSTPTVKGASRIEVAFEESDKRYYQGPCPECGEFQRLVWDQVQWGKERDENDLPLAEYLCIHCGSLIPHHKKTWMVKRGKWVPTRESRVRGYHLSSLYSPWMSWGQMVAEFESKKDDPTQLQTFVNTKLAETYDLANAEKWDSDSLVKLLEPMPVLPRRVAVLTAGVDVQDHSLVVQVDAWGPNEERWSIERRDIPGDTSTPAPWAELERALLSEYPLEGGGVLRIRAAMIDTGGHRTDEAYAFCKRHLRRLWWAGKGVGGEGRTLWPRTGANRFNRAKVPLHALGVDAGKESIHARLKHSMAQQSTGHRAGAGYWHFREDGGFNASYFAELTNEVQVPVYSNSSRGEHPSARRRRWVLRNPMIRNEALDISVYSLAALHGLLAMKAVRLDSPALPLSPRDGVLPLFEAALRPAPAPTPPDDLNTAQKKSNGHYAEIKKTEAPVEPTPRPTPPPTPAPVAAPSPGRGARKKRSQDW